MRQTISRAHKIQQIAYAGLDTRSDLIPTSQQTSIILCNMVKEDDKSSKLSSAYAIAPKYELLTKQPKRSYSGEYNISSVIQIKNVGLNRDD